MKRRTAAALLGLALPLAAVGCAKDPSPSQIRTEARRQLVRGGMSATQARCLVGRLDDALLTDLSNGRVPKTSSKAFGRYTAAVQACVLGGATTTTTKPAATTSTTAPG